MSTTIRATVTTTTGEITQDFASVAEAEQWADANVEAIDSHIWRVAVSEAIQEGSVVRAAWDVTLTGTVLKIRKTVQVQWSHLDYPTWEKLSNLTK
jgi:hypothetical protein